MASPALDRDKLHDAIYKCLATEKLCVWATTLTGSPISFHSVGIKGLGELNLPIETQQLDRFLRDLGQEETAKLKQPVVIYKPQLYEPESSTGLFKSICKDIAGTAVREAFNMDSGCLNVNVDARLEKLVICAGNETFTDTFNKEKEPGTFGCMLLQIPVTDVSGGGNVVVHYGEESIFLQFDVYSQCRYYVAVLAGKRKAAAARQDYTIVPANTSPCVMLVANLVWSDVVNTLPKVEADRFPQFVESAQLVNKALAGWAQLCHCIKKKHLPSTPSQSNSEGAHWVNTSAANPTGYYLSLNGESCKLPVLDASLTQALCLPLTRDYCQGSYSTSSLLEEDAVIYRVLSAISYINLELVLIKRADCFTSDWRETALQKSDVSVPIFHHDSQQAQRLAENDIASLNPSQHFAGNLRHWLIPPVVRTGVEPSRLFHTALLIHPKGANTNTDWGKYVLFHLEELLRRASQADGNEEAIYCETRVIIQDLGSFKNFGSYITKIITKILNAKGWKNWLTFVRKLMAETSIASTFPAFFNLAANFYHSQQVVEAKQLTNALVEVFFGAIRSDNTQQGIPFLLDLMTTLEFFSPSEPEFIVLLKEALGSVPIPSLAMVLQQQNKLKITNSKYLKYLQLLSKITAESKLNDTSNVTDFIQQLNTICFNITRSIVDLERSRSCQVLASMIINARDNRDAFVTHLANCLPAKDALDVVVGMMGREIATNLHLMVDVFLFLGSVESNVSLASGTRPKVFLSSVAEHHLETLCRLTSKLRNSDNTLPKSTGEMKMYEALLETLAIDKLHRVVMLPVDVVREAIESLFWWENDRLINSFVQQAVFIGDRSAVCFQAPRLQTFVAKTIKKGNECLGEDGRVNLFKLWLKSALSFGTTIKITGAFLSKALFATLPTRNATRCDDQLDEMLTSLVCKVSPLVLVHFLDDVHSQLMGRLARSEGCAFGYWRVLFKACQRLLTDTSCATIGSLNERVEKIVALVKTISRLFGGSVPEEWTRLVQLNSIQSTASLAVHVPDLKRRRSDDDEEEKDSIWAFRDATVVSNNQLEAFLRSDVRSQLFGRPFDVQQKALCLCHQLVKISPVTIRAEVKEIGGAFLCKVTKLRSTLGASETHSSGAKESKCLALPAPPQEPIKRNKLARSEKSAPQQALSNEQLSTETGGSSWCIDDAVVRDNLSLQTFLRSHQQSGVFPSKKVFSERVKAEALALQLKLTSPWPLLTSVKQVDGGYCAEVTKAFMKQSSVAARPALPSSDPVELGRVSIKLEPSDSPQRKRAKTV